MARKRMIDPNFWQNEDVGRLSFFERMVFIGLFANADDEGRGRANPSFLRALLFPYDDIGIAELEAALANVARHTSVRFYCVGGKRYYCVKSWKRWQKIDRPAESVLPPYEDGADDPGADYPPAPESCGFPPEAGRAPALTAAREAGVEPDALPGSFHAAQAAPAQGGSFPERPRGDWEEGELTDFPHELTGSEAGADNPAAEIQSVPIARNTPETHGRQPENASGNACDKTYHAESSAGGEFVEDSPSDRRGLDANIIEENITKEKIKTKEINGEKENFTKEKAGICSGTSDRPRGLGGTDGGGAPSACFSWHNERYESTGQRRSRQSVLTEAQRKRFNEFWEAYPRKVAPGEAEKVWAKLNPDDALAKKIIDSVAAAKAGDSRFREQRYTPHPSSWLNGKNWENVYAAAPAKERSYEDGDDFLDFIDGGESDGIL